MATYVAAGAALVLLLLAIMVFFGAVPVEKEVIGAMSLTSSIGIGALSARAHRL